MAMMLNPDGTTTPAMNPGSFNPNGPIRNMSATNNLAWPGNSAPGTGGKGGMPTLMGGPAAYQPDQMNPGLPSDQMNPGLPPDFIDTRPYIDLGTLTPEQAQREYQMEMNHQMASPGMGGMTPPPPGAIDFLGGAALNYPGPWTPGGNTNFQLPQAPGDTSSPGMGGKGGVASNPAMNVPQPPPMNPPQTGLPGRPVPVAPMTPIGPSLGNPGGPGVQPQQLPQGLRAQPIGEVYPNGQPVSFVDTQPPRPISPLGRVNPGMGNQPPRPNPFMPQNKMAPQMPQLGRANMPLRGPMLMNRGGAGRGGMIR
jgi:hypothetical protein